MKTYFLKKIKLASLFLLFSVFANAQNVPFHSDIQHFKTQDSLHFPPRNAILFIGSSSFTKWEDVQEYFPEYKIINRGFGGSTFPDVIRYANEIIFPYQPKQILIYEGDNDLASSRNITPDSVLNRFEKLFVLIKTNLPHVAIAFVSIKPSPSRQKLLPEIQKANSLIKEFLGNKKNSVFIDVYHKMLNKDGTPNQNIFIEDALHMNAKGYAIWQKSIKPYLIK